MYFYSVYTRMMKTAIYCLLLVSMALVGGQIQRPTQSCEEDINPLNECTRISDHCSNTFIEHCANLSDNVDNRQMTFFPNCFGQTNEYDANSLMNQFLLIMHTFSDNCTNLAIPLMCFGLYPKCLGQYRLAPCPELCDKFMAECIPPGVTVPWNCDQLFRSGPCVNNTYLGTCIKPTEKDKSLPTKLPPTNTTNSTSPSSNCPGLELCINESLPNCTDIRPSKCGLIRKSVAEKAFKKGYYFAAHVEILEEELLCKPEELVAFKAKIILDYYLACSINYNNISQKPVNSTVWIITDDYVKDCTKQCVRPELKIGKEYFLMGTGYDYEGIGHVWKLSGQRKTGGCVIYPWEDVIRDKKTKKLIKWTKRNYKCTDDKQRLLE